MGQGTVSKPTNNIKSTSLALTYTQVFNDNNKKWELDQDSIHANLAYQLMNDDVLTGTDSDRIQPQDIPQATRSVLKKAIEDFESISAAGYVPSEPVTTNRR